MSSNVLLWPSRSTAYWVTLAILLLVGSVGDLFLGRHIFTARSSSELSNTTEIWIFQWKITKLKGDWSICWNKEMLKVLGLVRLEKGRKTERNLLVLKTDKENGDMLLSFAFSKCRGDNGQKMKYKKFHPDIRKYTFCFWACPTGCSESLCSLSVESFKTLLHTVMSNLL